MSIQEAIVYECFGESGFCWQLYGRRLAHDANGIGDLIMKFATFLVRLLSSTLLLVAFMGSGFLAFTLFAFFASEGREAGEYLLFFLLVVIPCLVLGLTLKNKANRMAEQHENK